MKRTSSPHLSIRLSILLLAISPSLKSAQLPLNEGVFENPKEVGLVTSSSMIAFDREAGGLTHFVHRASGQEFVSDRESPPLFALTLTRPYEGKSADVSAADFRKVTVNKPESGKLELTFAEHASLSLSVRVSATIDSEGFVRLRIAVRNTKDWGVSRIQFPQFVAPAQLAKGAGDDSLLMPSTGKGDLLIENPGSKTYRVDEDFPDVQFCSLYNSTAGFYMATYDADGHNKKWGLELEKGKAVKMQLAHLNAEVPGRDFELPYDVVLGTFVGDWRDAADIYKHWAKQQPWCATKVSQRTDIPKLFREGSALLLVPFLHEMVQYKLFPFEDVPNLPSIAATYRARTQMPHIGIVPFGWENRGAWAGINYFPARPSDDVWRKVNAELHTQGNYTFMFPSGFAWVVKRKESRSGPAFDDTMDFHRREEMLVHNADGMPWISDYYADTISWKGLSASLCYGSAVARETVFRIFLDIGSLGSSIIQFDQDCGIQGAPCYSRVHGHEPGYTNQYSTDFRNLCKEVLKHGKSIDPEFGLSVEHTNETIIPYLATMWGRQCSEADAVRLDERTPGLFSYLYHEYLPVVGDGYSAGQGMSDTWGSAELRCFRLAETLARGLIPAAYMEQVPLKPEDEWTRTVSQAFISYCRPYARFPEYLLQGITRRPPKIECAMQDLWHYRDDEHGEKLPDGRKATKVTIRRPTVISGSFEAEDGSLGIVLVNTTPSLQQSTVELAGNGRSATLFYADRTEQKRWDECPNEMAVSLEPFGVRLITLSSPKVVRKI